MNQDNLIITNINGVYIKFEYTTSDERGSFFDIVENGFDENTYKGGVKHVYAAVTSEKLFARGNHFHFKNFENFFPMTGTLLWILLDCRKDSSTYGNLHSFITSYGDFDNKEFPVYSVKQKKFTHFTVPPLVYHMSASLTDEPAATLTIASNPFDANDVGKPEKELFEKVEKITSKYNVTIIN